MVARVSRDTKARGVTKPTRNTLKRRGKSTNTARGTSKPGPGGTSNKRARKAERQRKTEKTIAQGGNWERQGVVDELHKAARRNFDRRHVTIKGLNDLFQADLVEIHHSDENEGYKYLLTLINTFSKRAWAEPLKNKEGVTVARALEKIFEGLKEWPKYLQTDKGTDFFNGDVATVLERFGIKHYHSYSNLKASIIERFNRTLKSWMWKKFSFRGNFKWYDILDELLDKYNSRVHRTIGLAPKSVNYKNERIVLRRLEALPLPPKKKKNKFKVGDNVRISKFKHVFEKGYTPNWTTEVFVITKVEKTRPVTYKLQDQKGEPILGGFYEQELLKTKHTDVYLVEEVLEERGNKALVRWLGFPDSENQWIDKKSLID